MRRLTTRGEGASPALDQAIQMALVAELLDGSDTIWLLSPWISDIPVIDNGAGQVSALVPGIPLRALRLTEALEYLASAGSRIRVVVRNESHNEPVVAILRALRDRAGDIRVRIMENLHDKGLLTSRLYFEGSMNFTHRGREINEEGVTMTADSDIISRMRLDFASRFGDDDD